MGEWAGQGQRAPGQFWARYHSSLYHFCSTVIITDPCHCVPVVCVCVQDLGRRLREAESLAQQAQPKLAAKDREIQVVCQGWR